MNISLIEDDPDCGEDFRIMLGCRGHLVEVYDAADDVVSSIAKIVESDIVLLDLMMQLGTAIRPSEAQETGIAIYKRLRKVSDRVPILVVSARSKSEVWGDFEGDPFVGYLGKPVKDVTELLGAISELLTRLGNSGL